MVIFEMLMTYYDRYRHFFRALQDASWAITRQEMHEERVRINREELSKATCSKTGSWRFRIRCGSKYWLPIAKQMLTELCQREGIEWADISATIRLPEPGRIFTKSRGEKAIHSHG